MPSTNPTIDITFATPDPEFQPLTITDLITADGGLNDLISGSIVGSYIIYVTGSTTPAVNDQDKIWFKEDGGGRPLGAFKYYGGNWRKVYTHPIGTIVIFTGDPTALFDGTGLGVVNGDWDGFAICNGNNGTPNLSNLFLVGAQLDNVGISGYSSGWQTNVTGTAAQTGGVSSITLDGTNTYSPATPELTVGTWSADGNARATGGDLYGLSGTDPTKNATLIGAGAGVPSPVPIPTVPPFQAVCYCKFVGYS